MLPVHDLSAVVDGSSESFGRFQPGARRLSVNLLPIILALWAATRESAAVARDPATGYQQSVSVSRAGRLDWVFAVANQSPAQPPPQLVGDYSAEAQRYELYVPETYRPKGKPLPVLLYVSAGGGPAGWSEFQDAVKKQGFIFLSPHGAGNDRPMPERVRIVLDALDDVRSKFRTDPDRTYIGGISGGGRVAVAIAFALPEYFGGVIPTCAAGDLRDESWLRQRVIDRLSVALVTGDGDFNQGEVARFRGPMLRDVGVRAKIFDLPKLGHAIPRGDAPGEILKWLDEAARDRAALAKKHPASRVADEPPGREAWAKALLAEAQARLKKPDTLYSGLMQLQGLSRRWPDTPAAATAGKLLAEYDAKKDRPWEADDIDEQRRFLIARAKGVDSYAMGDLPPQYAGMRKEMLTAAIELWKMIVADRPESEAGREGAQRIEALEAKLALESGGK